MQIMKIEPGICSYIDINDNCYYIMDYHSGMGYDYSIQNQFILNFKKQKDAGGQQYKTIAIGKIADILIKKILPQLDPNKFIFVPIPPSKVITDPLYDDRMIKVLELVKKELGIPFIDLLCRPSSIVPSHQNQTTRTPSNHVFNLINNYSANDFINRHIIIIDDVVTTGSTYKAAKQAISQYLPNKITGLFLARAQ